MGKKNKSKDKDARQARKERAALKAEKKALKKDKKQARNAGDEDIDALLAEFSAAEAAKTAVTVAVDVPAPGLRTNFSLSAIGAGEALLFGGEYFDGVDTRCNNDLYRMELQLERGVAMGVRWTSISSPNTPTPRCGHQAAVYREHVYFFGGEFTTTTQFHHYGDLWRFHLRTNAWENLQLKGNYPSPRSGHRMAVWRSSLVVFGGFYEATRGTRWFDDLFIMSLGDFVWTKVEYRPHTSTPSARSGFGFACHPAADTMFIFGGYSKAKDAAGKKEVATLHTDIWALRLRPLATSGGVPTWERLARRGAAPSPRSGASCAVHKNKVLLFGGVFDEDGPRYTLESTFYGDVHAYDLDRCRYYAFQLKTSTGAGKKRRRAKAAAVDATAAADEETGENEDAESEEADEEAQFGFWDENGEMVVVGDEDTDEAEEGEDGEEDGVAARLENEEAPAADVAALEGEGSDALSPEVGAGHAAIAGESPMPPELSGDVADATTPPPLAETAEEAKGSDAEEEVGGEVPSMAAGSGEEAEAKEADTFCPGPRINAGMTVLGHQLLIYGGISEEGDKEVTLDDLWVLDLSKRQGWTRLAEGSFRAQEWRGDAQRAAEASDDDVASDAFESDDAATDSDSEAEGAAEGDEDVENTENNALVDGEEEEAKVEAAELSPSDAPQRAKKKKKKKVERAQGVRVRIQELHAQLGTDDADTTPSAGETCRDFFARTGEVWVRQLLDQRAGLADGAERFSEKELRREAFRLAQERYAVLEPLLKELDELEQQQQEAEREIAEAGRQRRGKR